MDDKQIRHQFHTHFKDKIKELEKTMSELTRENKRIKFIVNRLVGKLDKSLTEVKRELKKL